MTRDTRIQFSVYALLLGVAALAAGGVATAVLHSTGTLSRDTGIFILISATGIGLAFSLRPAATTPIDLAFLLAAPILLSPSATILAAVVGAAVATPFAWSARRGMVLARLGADSGRLLVMAGASCLAASRLTPGPDAPPGLPGLLAQVSGSFLASAIALHGMSWIERLMLPRSERTTVALPSLLSLAIDLLAVPAALLLVLGFRLDPRGGFLLAASLCLLTGVLVRYLHGTRRDLLLTRRDLRRRMDELQALGAIGRELAGSQNPDKIFERIANALWRAFPYDGCVCALFDPDTRGLKSALARDASGEPRRLAGIGSAPLAGWVLTANRALLLRDLRHEHLPQALRGALLTPGIRSLVSVPLGIEGRSAGFLCVQSRQPDAYDSHALGVIETIAHQAEIAIESARNYQRATRDEMTGLVQREAFFQRLHDEFLRAERYGSPFALLMLDLDGFKEMNDTSGHMAGDAYLRALGEVIRASLRGADVPCRYGGEEFCVLLPETDMPGARAIAERIREAVSRLELHFERQLLRTTISIGVAVQSERSDETPEAILQRADEALYAAKRAGKNRVFIAAA